MVNDMPTDFEVPDFFTANPKQKQEFQNFINSIKKFWGYFFVLILLLLFLGGSVVRVGAGERAVLFNIFGGVEKRILGEGIHIIVPLLQRATVYDVQLATYDFATEEKSRRGVGAGEEIHLLTSDGQRVDVELTVRVRPKSEDLYKLHKFIGPDYPEKIIFPMARTVLREVLAGYPVEDVYSVKRQDIQSQVQEKLANDLSEKYFIDVEEVLIRNVRFSKEFQDAIDRKQQAYQEFLKMEYVLSAEEAKRDSKILQAEGEAKAIGLRVGALLRNPDFIKFRRAQVYGKKAKLILSDTLE